MQDYAALKEQWAKLDGNTVAGKLAALNTMTMPAPAPVPQPAPDPSVVAWPQANGWQGPVNENDLVAAGIISDDDRKAVEQGKM